MRVVARAIARNNPAKMSRAEERYLREVIKPGIEAGDFVRWWYEPWTVRLTLGANSKPGVSYKPDFLVLNPDGTMMLVEVKPVVRAIASKGMAGDKSRDKLKWSASMFPMFDWVRVAPIAKKRGGGWETTWFSIGGSRE